MLKIKIVKSHSGIFRAILEELKRRDQSAIADLLSAGMISFAPPELMPKRDGRSFAVYGERERVILSACYQTLSQVANKKLSGNCIGGRKGFSRHSFLDFLKTAKEQKLNWVVITDVKNFFASISHEILQKILAGRFRIARDGRRLVMDLLSLRAPTNEPKGVFPGNPLGKLLGNVYLSGLDELLAKNDLLFTRYVDDIALFVKTKQQAERILGTLKEYLRHNLRMDLAENKTGIYHRYFNRFEFLGFSVIGENIGPSEENVQRFEQRVRNLSDEYKRKGIKKFGRRMNSVVYNFGHMYKKGNVKKLYSKLDEVVRASIRRYLKLSGKGELVNTIYSSPLRFPCNLAFSKEILSSGGFVSLVQIKEKFEGKDQKCELKTTGEMGGKNFIQNCRRVNAEKIQISVGDKVIITISNAGNVGPIRKSSISNGVNIGTTEPSQKLDVGSGNVKGQTGLCIGNDCRTSWPAGVAGGFCVFKRTNYVCPSWAPVQEGLKLIGSFNNLDDKRSGSKGHGYYITVCCGP